MGILSPTGREETSIQFRRHRRNIKMMKICLLFLLVCFAAADVDFADKCRSYLREATDYQIDQICRNREYGYDKYRHDKYGNEKYRNEKYRFDKYGNEKHGNEKYGYDKYGYHKYRNEEYGNERYGNEKYRYD